MLLFRQSISIIYNHYAAKVSFFLMQDIEMVILHWSMIASPKNLFWTFSQIWTASSLTRVFTKCLLKRFQTGSPTAIPPLDLRNTQPKIAFVMLTLFACEWFIRSNEQMLAWVYNFGSTTHPFNWKIQKRRKQGKVVSNPTRAIYTYICISNAT